MSQKILCVLDNMMVIPAILQFNFPSVFEHESFKVLHYLIILLALAAMFYIDQQNLFDKTIFRQHTCQVEHHLDIIFVS